MTYSQTKEYQKEYAKKHATKKRAIAKAHYYANREKKIAYQKQYQAEHKEQRKKYLTNTATERSTVSKRYYDNNKETIKTCSREFKINNPNYHKRWNKENYDANREFIIKLSVERIRKRLREDQNFKNLFKIRSRVRQAFRDYSTKGKIYSSKLYGVSYEKILKSLGECPGPREEYHIDHIMPLCLFNFNRPEDVKEAFAPSNHRWLKASENLSKQDKCVLFYL